MKRTASRSLILVVFTLVAMSARSVRAADAVELSGRIDAITVYRGQALVTRIVDVPAPGGLRETAT